MSNFTQELRYTLRRLTSSPGFTLTAILTLALAIGATTSIFSVVEGVLLRPLPFRDPGRLVLIKENVNKLSNLMDLPAPDVLTFAQGSRAFEQVGGFETSSMELSGAGEPARIATARLTAAVFPALGASPALGRAFTPQEDDQSQKVALISDSLWKGRFQGDRGVLGRHIDLDRNPYVIVGVMPGDFEFPLVPGKLSQTQLWVPMSFTRDERADAGDNFQYGAVARLKPGVTLTQAGEDVNRVAKQITADYPAKMGITVTTSLVPLKEFTVAQARPLVRVLFAAVIVVLLIACANLAGLLLVRGVRKRREIAVRRALGAPRLALVRHSLMESLLIGLGGGALGVFLAWAGLRGLLDLLPETLPRAGEIALNGPVLAFALVITLGSGLLCGVAPAVSALRISVNDGLRDGGRGTSGGAAHARLRSALVVTQIASALVLLMAAGLLLRSFARMRAVDPGFEPEHVVTASFALPSVRYQTQQQVNSFHAELLRRLQGLPGVKSAALASSLPMAEPSSDRFFVAEGYHPRRGAAYSSEAQAYVVGDYLRTLGIPLLRGRYLSDADTADSPPAVVVSRTLAECYWPGEDPIGKRIKWGVDAASPLPWMTVVGEVADTKQGALDSKDWNQVYQPLVQFPASWGDAAQKLGVHGQNMRIAVRTVGDPKLIENVTQRTVWHTTVLSAFALGAVLLAVLGIYGVIAFSVAQRTQEIAVRMALGAQPGGVVRLVLASGARLGLTGCVLGLAGAAAVTRMVQSMLFEVSPFDPLVFAMAVGLVLLLALLASFVPAQRAASIEPMEALRSE